MAISEIKCLAHPDVSFDLVSNSYYSNTANPFKYQRYGNLVIVLGTAKVNSQYTSSPGYKVFDNLPHIASASFFAFAPTLDQTGTSIRVCVSGTDMYLRWGTNNKEYDIYFAYITDE